MILFTGNARVYPAALWRVRLSDLLRAGQSGDWISVGARFSATVQTGPGANPASYKMGTGFFPEVKRPGVALTIHPHLAPRLRKEYSYTSTPPLALSGLF